jgi:guanylate cyclase
VDSAPDRPCTPVVIAGVIGERKFTYDLWGDTVNVASRMESHGLPDEIQISERTRERLDGAFATEPRGVIEVKGVGLMPTWFLRDRLG